MVDTPQTPIDIEAVLGQVQNLSAQRNEALDLVAKLVGANRSLQKQLEASLAKASGPVPSNDTGETNTGGAGAPPGSDTALAEGTRT